MLHGAMVLSEHPRAKVLAIHTEAAAAMPGVERIFTARDVPGERGTGLNVPDLPLFVAVGETTCCVGDFIAMVVADTQFHARQAAAKITVDYEVLEPITDPFTALEPGAPQVHSADTLRPEPESDRHHQVRPRRRRGGICHRGARDRSDVCHAGR